MVKCSALNRESVRSIRTPPSIKCSKCGSYKTEDQFNFRNKAKNQRRAACKVCTRKESKLHYTNNKKYYFTKNKNRYLRVREFYKRVKRRAKCKICSEDHIACLDFHHLRDKKYDLGRVELIPSIKALKEEMRKCEVLCSNCHRKLHYEEKQ